MRETLRSEHAEVLDVTRSRFEIVPQIQAEIANLMGEPFVFRQQRPSNPSTSSPRQLATVRDAAATRASV
jgi:hypothetical protein